MSKRIFIYGIIIFGFITAVFIKQNIITEERTRDIVSAPSEWKEKGKPVVLQEIHKKDVNIYTKITVTENEEGEYVSYVTKNIQKVLEPGQVIFSGDTGDDSIGEVVSVSGDLDLNTGMFLIEVDLDKNILSGESSEIVYVNTKVLKNVICLPSKIIFSDNGDYFVWVNKKGKACKCPVKLGKRNGYGVVIEEGLKEGDLAVLKGYTKLFIGDKIRPIKEGFLKGDKK